MPRKAKVQTNQVQPVEEPTDVGHEPTVLTKDDYLKAKATIKQFRENQKNKPKRPCSEKQLQALAQGRMKNQRYKKKLEEQQVKSSD